MELLEQKHIKLLSKPFNMEREMIDRLWDTIEREWNPDTESLDDYRLRKAEEWDKFFEALDKRNL